MLERIVQEEVRAINKNIIVGVIVVLVLIVAGYFVLNKSASQMPGAATQQTTGVTAATNTVTIQNFVYSPSTITVKVGDSVTWTNRDSVGHSATADDGSFDTGVLSQGQTGSVTFTKAGTYTYFCSVHPNMKGTVIVQ
ncbi:MAG: cupredoxin family copper-binding protein [bacterium]|nr:cupredoxin family copper-binding protein [bacterium]